MTCTDALLRIRLAIANAAQKAGRNPDDITLVAVSKTKPVADIIECARAGQRLFGENYVQELVTKQGEITIQAPDIAPLIEWHLIGHLQRNKVNNLIDTVACIQTIDSVKLAEAISTRAKRLIPILIEVNIGGETNKSGVAPDDLIALVTHIATLPHLHLRGLMTVPPYSDNPNDSRPYFQSLRQWMTRINDAGIVAEPLDVLSMGMSHDMDVAIEEGSTMVRVGTAIFGDRR